MNPRGYFKADSTLWNALDMSSTVPKKNESAAGGELPGLQLEEGGQPTHIIMVASLSAGSRAHTCSQVDTHRLQLVGGGKGAFSEGPSSQAIPLITSCTVKFCTNQKMLTVTDLGEMSFFSP